MKDYNTQTRSLYKFISVIYDTMDLICFPSKKNNPRTALAEFIPNNCLSVLDVCCGTGNSLISIALHNPKNNLIGIDLSTDMLRMSEKKINKLDLPNVSLQEMDATHLEFEDNIFDIVTTSLSLHEMPEDIMSSVLLEMQRVTKPGGTIYIMEWEKPQKKLERILFYLFPFLAEPKNFRDFLKLDWKELLQNYHLRLVATSSYRFSKVIKAIKL